MATVLALVTSHGLLGGGGDDCDYPAEGDVRDQVTYAFGDMTGNVVLPSEDDVVDGVGYGASGTELTGTFSCSEPPNPAVAGDMPFAAISVRLVARIAAALGTSTSWVRPVANDDYVVTEMENLFAYLRCYGPTPVDPTTGQYFPDDGAGRWRRVVGRRVRVYIYIRSGVDSVGGDEIALQGSDSAQVPTSPPEMPGIFALEESVLNAMDDLVLTYTDQTATVRPLTISPVHWIDSSDGPPVRKAENEAGLVRSHLDFFVQYTLVNQRVEPAPSGLPVPNPGN